MCAPDRAEWGVCLLLEQVVGLTDTWQMAVCDESCRVGGPGWGGDRARGQRGLVTGGGIWRIGLQLVVETTDNGCETPPFPPFFPPPPPLPAACLVLDGWRRQELQVGSD